MTDDRQVQLSQSDTQTDGSREFLHTRCRRRSDGTYVVERRGADSSGHRKVFESLEQLDRLVEQLPEEFTASELTRTGLTGGRRHLVLRHLVEHPRWNCTLITRQPLTARREVNESAQEETVLAD